MSDKDMGAKSDSVDSKKWGYSNIPVKPDTKKLFMEQKPSDIDQNNFVLQILQKSEILDEITDEPQTDYIENHVFMKEIKQRFKDVIGQKDIKDFLIEAIVHLDNFRGRRLPENRK